ncbi:MAG: heparan N-sulfatase [Cyclobacteriaceae bacterium]|nr:MAG: heparan N-sulfatase [Cyclobacteriaceae bacterium]
MLLRLPFVSIIFFGLISCQQSEKATPPNILFCIADDASFPHMSAYGNEWVNTPAFDKVAREGILFMNAYTPNAKCAPSRSCILTGRNSWQLEEAANHWPFFPAKFKTYVEALSENGYFTGYTGKGWGPGVAGTVDGAPRMLAGPEFQNHTLTPPTSNISGKDYSANFIDFLEQAPDEAPWCFWYGAHEPHRAYQYGSGAKLGAKNVAMIDEVPAMWPDTDTVRNDLLDYALELEYFDQHLSNMIAELDSRGQLENTIIVVTSDNGMPFPRVKSQEYEMSNHLPLAIMWPAGIKNPGRSVVDFVSFIDFAPTFIELAGIPWETTGMADSPGKSLTDIFNSEKEGRVTDTRDFVVFGKERHDVGRPDDAGYPIRGIVKGGYLYVRNYSPDLWPAGNPETGYLATDGGATKSEILRMRRDRSNEQYWQWNFGKRPAEELYQISEDPYCINNLIGLLETESTYADLKKQLADVLVAQEDPRVNGNGNVFETYMYSDDRSRNFYHRFMAGEEMNAGWVEPTDFEKDLITQ